MSPLLLGPAGAANYIVNSGFEGGVGKGLMQWGTSDDPYLGNLQETKGFLTNDAHSGRYGFVAKGVTYGRGMFLTAGAKTFSMWAKCSTAGAGPFFFGIVPSSVLEASSVAGTTNIAGTYTRYTLGYTAPSNGIYHFVCYTFQSQDFIIDDLQLEDGSSATTYAPNAAVELALSMTATNRMWFAGETQAVSLDYWNDGALTNARVLYQVFDMKNSNVVSGTLTNTLAAGTNTSVSVSLPSRYGWFRVVTRLLDVQDSGDELDYCFYPYPASYTTTMHATNDWLGGHSHGSLFHGLLEKKKGRKWSRTLSPNYRNNRWDSLEPTRGAVYTWDDRLITNLLSQGISLVITLTPSDGVWPTWATNANGTADMPAFSNFCYQVTAHMAGLRATYAALGVEVVVEVGPNEPLQSGPTGFGPTYDSTGDHHAGGTNKPINVQVATNYTKCMEYGIAGVTNASPTMKIIVGAGALGDGSWTDEAITNLLATTRPWISIVSTHNYGPDIGADPNDGVYTEFNASPHKTWMNYQAAWATWPGGAVWQIWDTEGGTYGGVSSFKGMNGLIQTKLGFPLWRSFTEEAGRGEVQQRQMSSVVRILTEALRCKGYGFAKFFYYDSRYFNNSSFGENSLPYPASFTQVDHPFTFVLSVAGWMVRHGTGTATNATAGAFAECYAGTNANGQAVLWCWANDKTNKTFTLDNSNYAVVDESGNQEQTNVLAFRLTRVPKYLMSGTRTLAQLSNSFVNANVVTAADTLPPQVSIDIAPSGLWSGATNAQLIKWTAIDDTCTAWTTAPHSTNVVYAWRLNGGNYGPYSQSNYVWCPNIPAGTNTFWVTASDMFGNTNVVSYDFAAIPAAAPDPPTPDPRTNGLTINVTVQLNVGTLNIR